MELIINIDGGSRGNPGPGASAWVIKDTKGKLIIKEGLFFKECTNNQAEFTALKMAILKAKELGAKSIKVRSDSLLLVKQFLGEYKIKNPQLQEIMAEIKAAAAKLSIVINHVPREQNKEADLMCNQTMDAHLKPQKRFAPAPKEPPPQKEPPPLRAAPPKTAKATVKSAQNTKEPVQLELFDLNNL